MRSKHDQHIYRHEQDDKQDPETGLVYQEDTAPVLSQAPGPLGERNPVIYTSVSGESREERLDLYDALSSEATPLSDVLGKTIRLRDVVVHWITRETADSITGEIGQIDLKRTVLIDEDGSLYQAVSRGVLSSLGKLIQIVGFPPYVPSIPIQAVAVKTQSGIGRAIVLRRAAK